MLGKYIAIGLLLGITTPAALVAQQANRLELGRLPTGASVAFVRAAEGEWGIEIIGAAAAPRILQSKPARIEIYRSANDILELASGYRSVEASASAVKAIAEISGTSNTVFHVEDRWTLAGSVVIVDRRVQVTGKDAGGFSSSVVLSVDPKVSWTELQCMAPGALYGDPTFDGDRSPGGTLNHGARHFLMREDILPAPLFALSFTNGSSVAVLDPAPRGDSTVAETKLAQPVMIDGRFQFGALGAWQQANYPIEFGFCYPGSTVSYAGAPGTPAAARWTRRYHPISDNVPHHYQVRIRFGESESFPEVTRNTWRWAWDTLKPAVTYIDVEQMRRILLDHLQAQSATTNGRTAIPFVLNTISNQLQWNWTMAAMGFVGKNLECADQLLREGDRDPSERGQRMRRTGLSIISSMIEALPTVPLKATGFDLSTGQPWDHIWLAPWLRNATEDMRVLVRAYRREHALGRDHPEWIRWVKTYVDWLLLQQRPDGSFPRRWKTGSNEVAEPSGTTSYAPVPLLVLMTDETGDPKYRDAASRAAEFVWTNWGTRGLFIGGASDNPDITDKEAGMLSLEAFLSLYEATHEPKWLERAEAAGSFAESWIWIWNLPMPLDADDAQLHWKKGVPTIGLQGITARGAGGVDEYLDWAVPSYAKLYHYTKDPHYLDVARILLHNTKAMVALPGRQYDMRGIGWQQEHWRMGPGGGGRGVGGHRFWLPWVSANHLYGITGLEEYDPALFKLLCTKPPEQQAPASK